MVEATEHHEIVLEVESELRGLRKALDIMVNHLGGEFANGHVHINAVNELRQQIEFGEGVLEDITDGDDDE